MMRDEKMYSNPNDFSPDRFVGRTEENDDYDPTNWVFGFGRRYTFKSNWCLSIELMY